MTPPSRFASHCHCSNCRRAHGAAFVTYVGYPAGQFEVLQGGEDLARYGTDTGAVRSFCRRCGTTLTYQGPRWPDEIHVALAVLDGPVDRRPETHVYVDHKAAWWEIRDDRPRFEKWVPGYEPKGLRP